MPANDIGTFLSAFMGPVNEKLEERHQNEQKLKDAQRKIQMDQYQDVLNNPQNYDPAIYPQLRKQASDALGKLLNPEARKMHGKIGGIVEKIQGIFAGPQARQAQQAQIPPPQLPSQGGQSAAGAPQSAAQTLGAPNNFAQFLDQASAARLRDPVQFRREQELKELDDARARGASDEEIDEIKQKIEFKEKGDIKFPKASPLTSRKLMEFKLPDGTRQPVQWDPKTGIFYDRNTRKPVDIPNTAIALGNPANVRPVFGSPQSILTKAQAIEQMNLGKHLLDEQGKIIEPEQISDSPNMVLQQMEVVVDGEPQTRYIPRNINDQTYVWNNLVHFLTPPQLPAVTQGALQPPAVGQRDVGSTAFHETRGTDVYGNPVFERVEAGRKPNTPGTALAAAQTALPAPQLQSPQRAPGTPPAAPQAPGALLGQIQPGAPPNAQPRRGGVRPAASLPPGIAQQQTNQAIPITGVAGTLFGDPQYPGFKSLSDFAYLADNPDSAERIATAVKVVQKASSEGSADLATVNAGPVHVGFGEAGNWVSYFLNLPKWASGEQVSRIRGMMQDLARHPDEVEAFNAFMTANADIIALRSVTKASPAAATVQALRNELANMMTAPNSKAFRDSLKRTAQLIQKSTELNKMIRPDLKARIDEVLGGKKGAPTAAAERNLSNPKDEEIKKKLDKIF